MTPKMLFVQREVEDKLGPMILTAYLKSFGFESSILIDPLGNIPEIKRLNPDFIGISICSPSVNWALDVCRVLKKEIPNALTILGGPHPTFFPQVIEQPNIDAICIGEGELPIREMFQKFDGSIQSISRTPNLWVKVGDTIVKNPMAPLLTEDELSALPFSDRTHYQRYPSLRNNPHKKVWTSRGCPFHCSYCFNHAYQDIYKGLGDMVRQRSVNRVIEELKELKRFGWKCLEIVDDHLLLSREWVAEFCERYEKEIGLPFSCCSTAKCITPTVVKQLKKAGCKVILFAIESGVEQIRRKIYNKPISNEDIYKAADALHAGGLRFLTFNMIGLPEETLDDIYATVQINQKIKVSYPWCSILQPYPGTKILDHMRKNSSVDLASEFSYSYFQRCVVKEPEKQKMFSNAQKIFAHCVKSNVTKPRFTRLVQDPPLQIDKLYPALFYWHYGSDIRKRYGLSWMALFRYWLYSK